MRRSYSFLTSRRLFSSSRPRRFGFLSSYDAIAANARYSPNYVRRSCTSGGLLLIGLGSPSTPPPSTVAATCAAAADTTFSGSTSASTTNISLLARQTWHQQCQNRQLHSKTQQLQCGSHILSYVRQRQCERPPICATDARRYKSFKSVHNNQSLSRQSSKPVHDDTRLRQEADSQRESPLSEEQRHAGGQRQSPPPPTPQPPNGEDADSITSSMSKYLQSHLPKISHRPTKEELLAAANGFTQRTKVRLKWLTIRSMRPWNADEWGAFVSWFMLGHLVWFLVGTTTFVSLLILTINTVFAQGTLTPYFALFAVSDFCSLVY